MKISEHFVTEEFFLPFKCEIKLRPGWTVCPEAYVNTLYLVQMNVRLLTDVCKRQRIRIPKCNKSANIDRCGKISYIVNL